MKTLNLAGLDLPASNIVLGGSRISPLAPGEVRELVSAALDAGINFFDTAPVYGTWTLRHGTSRHECESLLGAALGSSAVRDKVIIQTKTGIGPGGGYDSSYGHIVASVDESLAALRTDYIDILLIHRPDALVEVDEVAAAFEELHRLGKVRHFGVSNHTPGQIELLKRSMRQPLVVNQMRLSLVHASLIAADVVVNDALSSQSIDRDGRILTYSQLNGMNLQAWSPFQNMSLEGVFIGDREAHPELNDALDELAATYGVTPYGIAVAWITRHPANIQVVVGATTPEQVRQSAAGSEIPLTRDEWYRLFRAAGYIVP